MITDQSSLNRKSRMERLALIKQRHRSLILQGDVDDVDMDDDADDGLDDDMEFMVDDE